MAQARASRRDRIAEPGRLAALRRAGIDDSEPNEVLDWLTQLTTRMLDTPVALVSLVDRDRQVFRSACGLDLAGTPLSHSFCQHVVAGEDVFVVRDANDEPLVAGNLAIENLGVVAYAGVPLIDGDGYTLGSFCAIDHEPREWRSEDVDLLSGLAAVAIAELDRRGVAADLDARERQLRRERVLMDTLVAGMGAAAVVCGRDGRILRVIGDTDQAWGVSPGGLVGRMAEEVLTGLPGGGSLEAVHSGERPGGSQGGGWGLLPLYDDAGTVAELVIVRAPGAGAVRAPEVAADPPPPAAALLAWVGLPIDDPSGVPIGRTEGVLSQQAPGRSWLLARLQGGRHVLIPSDGSVEAGGRIVTSRTADEITASPAVDPGRVDEREAEALARHYGLPAGGGALDVVGYDIA
ncbi:MAG TPA: GAF domain-containing protein [Thermoleophilaceae bacterium]|nr:GAF domain-containing protein [Thermoleophilaceae bacterium]